MNKIVKDIEGVLDGRFAVSVLGSGAVVSRDGVVIVVVSVRDNAVFVNTGRVDGVEARFESGVDAADYVEDAVYML